MKLIKITNKEGYIKVDDEDYEELSAFPWRVDSKGYVATTVFLEMREGKAYQKMIIMHRMLMGFPDLLVDHINHDLLDNRKENLRIVTYSQNNMNRSIPNNNKTGYKGVCYKSGEKRYVAKIGFNGKDIQKSFKTLEEAVKQRKEWEAKYHGKFAVRD